MVNVKVRNKHLHVNKNAHVWSAGMQPDIQGRRLSEQRQHGSIVWASTTSGSVNVWNKLILKMRPLASTHSLKHSCNPQQYSEWNAHWVCAPASRRDQAAQLRSSACCYRSASTKQRRSQLWGFLLTNISTNRSAGCRGSIISEADSRRYNAVELKLTLPAATQKRYETICAFFLLLQIPSLKKKADH